MSKNMLKFLNKEITNFKHAGLYKDQFNLSSGQGARVDYGNKSYINLSSHNYLGFVNDVELLEAAQKALETYGTGLYASRPLGGSIPLYKDLETQLSQFLQTDETILFNSNYIANIGLFDSIFNYQDYIFCDVFSHPSLFDGIQICSAKKFYYRRNDLNDLEDKLKRSPRARFRLIVTDGVFAIDGKSANLKEICELAEKYDALLLVHDSDGLGVMGENGLGSHEEQEVLGKVDLISGSFDYVLGGSPGGFISGRKSIITWLKQNSKAYVFSSAPSPIAASMALQALHKLENSTVLLEKLRENTRYFRKGLNAAGFHLIKNNHPIVPILVNDAVTAQKMVSLLYRKGIFITGLCFPVVPKGYARLRAMISASHTEEDLEKAITAIKDAGHELDVLGNVIKIE